MNWKNRLITLQVGDRVKILPQCSKSPYVGYENILGKTYTIERIHGEIYVMAEETWNIQFHKEELSRVDKKRFRSFFFK